MNHLPSTNFQTHFGIIYDHTPYFSLTKIRTSIAKLAKRRENDKMKALDFRKNDTFYSKKYHNFNNQPIELILQLIFFKLRGYWLPLHVWYTQGIGQQRLSV